MGFVFHAACAPSDIGTLFNSVILSGNSVIGKANDRVESKDPMFLDTTPGNARRSHCAVIARVPHSCAFFAQEWEPHLPHNGLCLSRRV